MVVDKGGIIRGTGVCTGVVLGVTLGQGVISWRASGDRQISLSASDERAFANFRVKNVVFTGTHFCAVLSMVGERAFVNFRKFVNYVHIFAEVLSLLLAE